MAKYLGLGVSIEVDADDAGGGAYAVIAQVLDINGPETETDDIDTTTRDVAPTSFFRTFMGGWVNGGEVSLEVVFDPTVATHVSLLTLANSRLEVPWKIKWPSATSKMLTFRGYVKSPSPSAPLEDKLTCSFSIKVTGEPVWAAAAA